MTTPTQLYTEMMMAGDIKPDVVQQALLPELDRIQQQLIKRQRQRDVRINTVRRKIKPRPPVLGIYLWGSVGIGKTFLLDLLFGLLPVKKYRAHFHHFMRDIHEQLNNVQGVSDPLKKIAYDIAEQYTVMFLDEFVVNDIADAMILGELFSYLFARGLCLITTSNRPPDELYFNGIQRERFLPAIALLKHFTKVKELAISMDYRRQFLQKNGVYFHPLSIEAQQQVFLSYQVITNQEMPKKPTPITILDRSIPVIAHTSDVLWCDFKSLCSPPRCQLDYLELAKQYSTFIISDVPIIKASHNSVITLFIYLIDVLYDTKKNIIISAAASPGGLYTEGDKIFEYQRTVSRIIEMSSSDYTKKVMDQ